MNACILSIGDEILLGNIVNTNSQFLAEQLTSLGFNVKRIISISDDPEQIRETLEFAAGHTDLVISTGGLGPTSDDRTRSAIAQFFDDRLIQDPIVLRDVQKFLSTRGRQMNQANREQALVPSKAKILRNRLGTAPGLWLDKQGTVYIFLPGVPHEMKELYTKEVKPRIKEHFDLPVIYFRFVHTLGIPEAELAEALQDFEKSLPRNVQIAYLPSPEDIRIRLTAKGKDLRQIKHQVDLLLESLISRLGDKAWGLDNDNLQTVVKKLFVSKNITLSTAESCTGGNIAHMITSVPGSSEYYKGTVVAYANEIKQNMLGIQKEWLEKYGAVSQPVVEQMALGVKRLMNTDFAVAISGIAGPTGGTPEKPVGTTWIAVATPQGVVSDLFRFGSSREINIRRASATALHILIIQVRKFKK